MEVFFQQPGVTLEYIEIVDPNTLEKLSEIKTEALIAVAARVGTTRLIDNLRINLQCP